MLQIFKDARYDFMGPGRIFLGISVTVMLLSVVVMAVRGLNFGIEFTGGTEMQVKYRSAPDIGAIRSAIESAGLAGPLVTTIGDPSDHEVYIRLGTTANDDGDVASRVAATLRSAAGATDGRVDLNTADKSTLEGLLRNAPGLSTSAATELAADLTSLRRERAIFGSIDELNGTPGLDPAVFDWLKRETTVGPMSVRSQSFVGPTVGRELMSKAMWAIGGSLVGMLLYIAFRFQFQWGVAAVVALIHDTVITLGLVSFFQKEVSLPVVAAFLSLIGYSVNDTVVIFDRIRENLATRGAADLRRIVNDSVNQTLSRTIITSALTWLVVMILYLFGGTSLNPFAFVLTVGVIVGSYSTIYIAATIMLMVRDLVERRQARAGGPIEPKKARKMPRSKTA